MHCWGSESGFIKHILQSFSLYLSLKRWRALLVTHFPVPSIVLKLPLQNMYCVHNYDALVPGCELSFLHILDDLKHLAQAIF